MVEASAPGKVAATTTEGGVICGNRATGSSRKATEPASVMTIASTVAKIGRSMKKLLTKRGAPRRASGTAVAIANGRAGLELLRAVDDHHVARREALFDHPVAALLLTHFNVALLRLAGAVDDPDVVLVLQELHRALRKEQRIRAARVSRRPPGRTARHAGTASGSAP